MLDRPWCVWALALGGVLAFDASLMATGHRSLSQDARPHRAVVLAGVAYLGCHLVGWPPALARHDPLNRLGRGWGRK